MQDYWTRLLLEQIVYLWTCYMTPWWRRQWIKKAGHIPINDINFCLALPTTNVRVEWRLLHTLI